MTIKKKTFHKKQFWSKFTVIRNNRMNSEFWRMDPLDFWNTEKRMQNDLEMKKNHDYRNEKRIMGMENKKMKKNLRLARLDLATLGLWDLRSANWAKPASISVSLSLYLTTLIFFHRFPFSSSLFSFSFSSIHLVYSIPCSVRFAFSTKWFATWIVNI